MTGSMEGCGKNAHFERLKNDRAVVVSMANQIKASVFIQ